MSLFSNIGHAVASFGLGIFYALTGKSTAGQSVAVQAGAAAGSLLEIAEPGAQAIANAAATALGDIVQAKNGVVADVKAGDSITITVSAALASAITTVGPDIEKLLAAFHESIAPAPAPVAAPAA